MSFHTDDNEERNTFQKISSDLDTILILYVLHIFFRPCVSEGVVFDNDDTEAAGTAKVQIAMK